MTELAVEAMTPELDPDAPELHQDEWDEHPLNVPPADVARLPMSAREERVRALMDLSYAIHDRAVATFAAGLDVVGQVILFSGGNDSTLLAHLFRSRATHTAHANTGIGVEATRQYVRDTSTLWALPLIEKHPPKGSTYRELVLDQGFPGPAHHWKMYQRLKERALRLVRKELVHRPRKERVVFFAGRRRWESERRATIPAMERLGSTIWVSPLILWTKPDMTTYRLMAAAGKVPGGPVPTNEVSDLLHMSGECLCGSFAHSGELEEVGVWYPEVRADIEALERELEEQNADRRREHIRRHRFQLSLASYARGVGNHPAQARAMAEAAKERVLAFPRTPKEWEASDLIAPWKCRWGWGADKGSIQAALKGGMSAEDVALLFARSGSGPMCSSCDARSTGGEVVVV